MKLAIRAVDKPFNIFVIFLIFILLGVISFKLVIKQSFPNIVPPHIIVSIPYPEASPKDIEIEIAKFVEKRLYNEIEDIKNLRISSYNGLCIVHFEFQANFDLDIEKKREEIKEIIDDVKKDFPEGVKEAKYRKINFSEAPIVGLFLYSEKESFFKLNEIAKKIQIELISIEGVSNVTISDERAMEFSVFVRFNQLKRYNISLAEIFYFFDQTIKDKPGGKIKIQNTEYNIQILSDFKNIENLQNQIFRFQDNGNPIYLKDIVDIRFGETPIQNLTRFNRKNSISMGIVKKKSANILSTYDHIKERLEKIKKEKWFSQSNTNYHISKHQVDLMNQKIYDLQKMLITTSLLVFIPLVFIIGFRYACIIILSIPVCFLSVFIGFFFFGQTFNFTAQFGFSMVMGMVIDGAIVMLETVYRKLERRKSVDYSIKYSLKLVGRPIIISSLTTMAGFFPLFFIPGTTGEFMKIIPQTIIFALIGAIIYDHFFLPFLCKVFLKSPYKMDIWDKLFAYILKRWNFYQTPLYKIYSYNYFYHLYNLFYKLRKFSFKYPNTYMSINTGLLVSTFLIFPMLNFQFFPIVNGDYLMLNFRNEVSRTVEDLDNVLKDIESQIHNLKMIKPNLGIQDYIVYGNHSGVSETGISGKRIGNNSGQGYIILYLSKDKSNRLSTSQISEELHNHLILPGGMSLSIQQPRMGPPVKEDLTLNVTGEDKVILKRIFKEVRSIVLNHPKIYQYRDNFTESSRSINFKIKINYKKIALYGLSSNDIQKFLNIIYYDKDLASHVYKDEIYKFKFQLDEEYKKNLDKILIFSPKIGRNVFLSDVVDIELAHGELVLQRLNLKNIFKLEASIMGDNTNEIIEEIITKIKQNIVFPKGYSISTGGSRSDLEYEFQMLMYAFIFSIIFIYLIVAIQFQSFLQSGLTNVSITYSIFGVFLALLISGESFSIIVMYGIISLVGISANDSILLIDSINIMRKKGVDRLVAIEKSARIKARPVVLTSLTMILGVLPYILASDELWASFAWAVAGGLFFTTVQTLITLPLLYEMVARFKEKLNDKILKLKQKIELYLN